jgi:hypothetical protein
MAVKHIAWMSMLFSISNCTPTPSVNAPQAGNFSSAYSSEDGADKNIDGSGASRSKKGAADASDATAVDLVAGPVGNASALQELIKTDAASNGGQSVIYVTIDHLSKDGQQNETMDVVRKGLVKVLNSVSMAPSIVNLQAIDAGKTVYRVNLADFKQAGALGRIKSAAYAQDNVSTVGNATVIKGDWLVYALSRPEVYDPIMKLPQLGRMLDAQLGVDYSKAKYINAEQSEVAFGGRVLARVPIELGGKSGGYYWRSYDFVRDDVKQRGFRDPASIRTTQIPEFVAGEFFFSLPNGLQGYYLTGFGDQHRYDVPAFGAGGISPGVASDSRRPQDGLTRCVGGKKPCGIVINGESCMTCHASGINFPTSVAGTNNTTMDEMTKLINQDRARFATALQEMGIDPNAAEPIYGTLNAFRARSGVTDKRVQASEVSGLTGR